MGRPVMLPDEAITIEEPLDMVRFVTLLYVSCNDEY